MNRAPMIAALLLAAYTSACDSSQATSSSQIGVTLTPPPSFLSSIVDAPMTVAYSGKRRVTFHYAVEGQAQVLDYTEQVYSNGHGQYLVDPSEVASPAMTVEQHEVFGLMQKARDSFFYLHRDFCIRDLALFQQNYAVSARSQNTTVAGRACVALDVRPQSADVNRYRIEVDPQTGLVLRWREFADDGATVALVEFLDFTLNPDLTNVPLHGPQFAVEPLDLATSHAQLGFDVRVPRLLPNGYQLLRTDKLQPGTAPDTSPWARLTYGDGVEQIFYLYTEVPPSQSVLPGVTSNDPLNGAHVVWTYAIGPWTVAVGEFGRKRCSVMGKVGEAPLLDMIQSAIE